MDQRKPTPPAGSSQLPIYGIALLMTPASASINAPFQQPAAAAEISAMISMIVTCFVKVRSSKFEVRNTYIYAVERVESPKKFHATPLVYEEVVVFGIRLFHSGSTLHIHRGILFPVKCDTPLQRSTWQPSAQFLFTTLRCVLFQ